MQLRVEQPGWWDHWVVALGTGQLTARLRALDNAVSIEILTSRDEQRTNGEDPNIAFCGSHSSELHLWVIVRSVHSR